MCGLVGLASTYMTRPKLKLVEQALYADALRGFHSTGMAIMNKSYQPNSNWRVDIMKRALIPTQLFNLPAYDDYVDHNMRLNLKAIMGHNRLATQGSINDRNAHPFHAKHIIMAHNGTLRTWDNLPDHKYFSVDSECIANSIATIGAEETIALLNGAFALTWFDLREGTLNMVRNHERTLAFYTDEDVRNVMWGSESLMVNWILERNHENMPHEYDVEPKYLYKFKLDEPTFADFECYEVDFYKPKRNYIAKNLAPKHIGGGADVSARKFQQKAQQTSNRGGDNPSGLRRTAKRKKKFTAALAGYGLKYQQDIKFHGCDFDPYVEDDVNGRGQLHGYMLDDPWCSVTVHNFDGSLYYPDRPFIGRAVTITDSGGYDVLHCDNVRPRRVEDGKGNEVPIKKIVKDALAKASNESKGEQCEIPFKPQQQEIESDEVDESKPYDGPTNRKLSKDSMDYYTRHGCCNCGGNIEEHDYHNVHWMANGLPMCNTCFVEFRNMLNDEHKLH